MRVLATNIYVTDKVQKEFEENIMVKTLVRIHVKGYDFNRLIFLTGAKAEECLPKRMAIGFISIGSRTNV